MTALAIAAGLVGLAAVAAAWDAVRLALAAQVEMTQARADAVLSERLDALHERVATVERSQRDAALARVRR